MTAVWNGWMRCTAKGSSFLHFSNGKLRCFWTVNWFLHFVNDVYPWQPADFLCPWHTRTYCLNGDSKHWQPFWQIGITIKAPMPRNWKNTKFLSDKCYQLKYPEKPMLFVGAFFSFLILQQLERIISQNCFLGYSSATSPSILCWNP